MNKLVVVKPKRTDNAEVTKSSYEYPLKGGLQAKIITYNRTLGDFLKEQMWLISGTQEQIDIFVANVDVTLIGTWNEANILANSWNPDRKIMNDSAAVMVEIDKLVIALKLEAKPVPAVFDSDDVTPGIVIEVFSLGDCVKVEDID